MGIIDKANYTLNCETCGITEKASILDKGSNWGGSHWQSGSSFTHFTTSWSGGGKSEPELLQAQCKQCGQLAKVQSNYGGY